MSELSCGTSGFFGRNETLDLSRSQNGPLIIDDALKAVQAERNVKTNIRARSTQRIGCVGGKDRWKISSH